MEKIIQDFLNDKHPVIVGISSKDNKWGNELFRIFMQKGYNPIPISKQRDFIDDIQCLKNVDDLPPNAQNVIISLAKQSTEDFLLNINNKQIKRVWFVYGSKSQKSIEIAKQKSIEVIYGYCPLMFINREGIHKFHYKIKKLFSK